MELQARYDRLKAILKELGEVLVAFSGGVDSTLLAKVAHDVLGDRAVAVTADSPSLARRELAEAKALAEAIGMQHWIIPTHELDDPDYAANPENRCYFCKSELFTRLEDLAQQRGFRWLAYGENADDGQGHRPGARAAQEFGVSAPLREAGLTKADIRALSKQLGLPTWDKAAFACLSSRFPVGSEITAEKLRQVEEAEQFLWASGFRQFRVRHHGDIARIEVGSDERLRLLDLAESIAARLQQLGFRYTAMDLLGYRTGSTSPATAPVKWLETP
ncbi:MAG TPA: ATP-dependent sacrificial sulfur transferase LarE [Symbiobacteriaceae bacterium]|jgi:uncharacterized protein